MGLLQICAAGLLWGTGGLAVQLLRERVSMSVLTISAYRMALAVVVLALAVALGSQVATLGYLMREQRRRVILIGVTTATYQTLYFGSVSTVGVSVATVVTLGLPPVLLTVLDAIRARRGPSSRRLIVVCSAIAGLALVSSCTAQHGNTAPRPMVGLAFALASGTAFAAATAASQPLAREHAAPVALAAATTAVGTLVLLPIGVGMALVGAPVATNDVGVLAILLYLGCFTMAMAYGLLYAGLRTTSSSSAVVATLFEPVTAAVAAALLLDERLGGFGAVGAALILASIVGLRRGDDAGSE